MRCKSKIRLILIPLCIFTVIVLCIIPYGFFIKDFEGIRSRNSDGSISVPTLVGTIFMLSVLLFIIFRIYFYTLIVTIDELKSSILFYYPFRQIKKKYEFNEVLGFRFDTSFSEMCYFKVLIFKTVDNKIFRISDYETQNLRKIECLSIKYFKIFNTKEFEPISKEEQDKELNKSIIFDIEQAKSYRFTAFLGIALSIFTIVISESNSIHIRNLYALLWISSCVLTFFCFYFILKSKRTINSANKALAKFGRTVKC